MQEYYLDGNNNKTKTSFYQDINSGIYNNVAIGKIYFDNRLLWTAPKKKYAIINTNALNKIRVSEGDQYNYLGNDLNFIKSALSEQYNVALKGSTAAIYAKEGKLYSFADYAYFDTLELLSQKIGLFKEPGIYNNNPSPININFLNSQIYFNKVFNNYSDTCFFTFQNTSIGMDFNNFTFPKNITHLNSIFSNAWGLAMTLPVCPNTVLDMIGTYEDAGGGVYYNNILNQYCRLTNCYSSKWAPLFFGDSYYHSRGGTVIGDNVIEMDRTFQNSALYFYYPDYNLFGPNTSRLLSTYRNCQSLECTNFNNNFFHKNIGSASWTFADCSNLRAVTVGCLNKKAQLSAIYYNCPNIQTVDIDADVTSLYYGNEYTPFYWNIGSGKNHKHNISVYITNYYGDGKLLDACWLYKIFDDYSVVNKVELNQARNLVNIAYCCSYLNELTTFVFCGNNTVNMDHCCAGCHNLVNFYQSDGWYYGNYGSNLIDASHAFYECWNLSFFSSLIFKSRNLQKIDYAFSQCRNLRNINAYSGPWSVIGGNQLTEISYPFDNCFNLGGNLFFSSENIRMVNLGCENNHNNILNIFIKSNTLTNNSFSNKYGKNIWSNNNGYDDAVNNIFIYYADKHPYYYMYENWG